MGRFRYTPFPGTCTKCCSKVFVTILIFRSLVFLPLDVPFSSAVHFSSSFSEQVESTDHIVDRDWDYHVGALVPRKSGRLAIRLPLRHDSSPVDVPLLTGNGPPKISVTEVSLFTVSVCISGIATWLFLWTIKSTGSKNVTARVAAGSPVHRAQLPADMFDERNRAFTICACACHAEGECGS